MPPTLEQPTVIVAILLLVFFAQALKEIGIPSPGLTQSLLLFAGYQFSSGGLPLGIGIILFAFLGSLCGAYLIFCLARFGGSKILTKLYRYLVISPEAMEKAGNRIAKYPFLTVMVGRSIPGLMVPTSIVAGTIKMPIGKFFLGILFSLSLWVVVLTTLGGTFRHFTPQIEFSPQRFLFLLVALLAFGILIVILSLLKKNARSHMAKGTLSNMLRDDE